MARHPAIYRRLGIVSSERLCLSNPLGFDTALRCAPSLLSRRYPCQLSIAEGQKCKPISSCFEVK